MEWKFDDGGRSDAGFKGKTGDCVTRAVAIASGRPYQEIYAALASGMGSQRKAKGKTARNGVSTTRQWFKDYMRLIGFEWTPTMQIGSGCKVHLSEGELPDGRLVVAVSRHYTAVINGVIHDTYNPQREPAEFSKFPGWEGVELKPNQTRNINGVHTIRRRCVYGYWRLAV